MKPKPVTQDDWFMAREPYSGEPRRSISKRALTSAVAGLKLEMKELYDFEELYELIDKWLQGVAKNSSDPKWRLEE